MNEFTDFEKALTTYVQVVTSSQTTQDPRHAREALQTTLDRYIDARIEEAYDDFERRLLPRIQNGPR